MAKLQRTLRRLCRSAYLNSSASLPASELCLCFGLCWVQAGLRPMQPRRRAWHHCLHGLLHVVGLAACRESDLGQLHHVLQTCQSCCSSHARPLGPPAWNIAVQIGPW